MKFASQTLLLSIYTCLQGCGSEVTSKPVSKVSVPSESIPTAVSKASGELEIVENQDYQNWAKFKIGTALVRKKISKNNNGSVTEIQTLKLKELNDDKVVLECQITVERPESPPKVNPPFSIEYYARFPLPKNMNKDQFTKPSLKAVDVGEVTVTVLGKEYKARLFTWEDQTESGPMPQKLWQSNEVPGRFLKQENSVKRNNISTIEELVEIKLPGEPSTTRP